MEYLIYSTRLGTSNCYIIKTGNGCIMIDAGGKKKTKKFIKFLKKHSIDPKDIKYIIVTHTHYDHVGSLKEISNILDAKIVVHENESSYLRKGFTKFPKGTLWITKLISNLGNRYFQNIGEYDPVEADIKITGEYILSDFDVQVKIFHTPGHTLGSICVAVDNKELFAGDTLFNMFFSSTFPPFANNWKQMMKSWEFLISEGYQRFYPGHGKPFSKEKLNMSYKKMTKKIQ